MDTRVMPIKIFVKKAGFFSKASSYFTRDGEPLESMVETSNDRHSIIEELEHQLYCKLMSIKTVDDAEQILKSFPNVRFAYHLHPAFKINEIDTMEHYYAAMVDAVDLFNDLRLFIETRRMYQSKMDTGTANYTCLERTVLLDLYSKHFRLLNRNPNWDSLSNLKEYYFDIYNKVDEVNEQYCELGPEMSISYSDLMDEYFDGRDDLFEQHIASVLEQVNQIVDTIMFEDVSTFVSSVYAVLKWNVDRSPWEIRPPEMGMQTARNRNSCGAEGG